MSNIGQIFDFEYNSNADLIKNILSALLLFELHSHVYYRLRAADRICLT